MAHVYQNICHVTALYWALCCHFNQHFAGRPHVIDVDGHGYRRFRYGYGSYARCQSRGLFQKQVCEPYAGSFNLPGRWQQVYLDYPAQRITYNKNGLTKGSGGNPTVEMIKLVISKIVYFMFIIGLPLLLTNYSLGFIILGFLVLQITTGLFVTTIFQLAHVIEETDHPLPTDNGEIENAWAIHQLETTANFAKKNRILSWFVGGLNYQVEHHLFYNICHIHYKKIAPIVKQTAQEFGIPYYEKTTFWDSLGSHIRILKKIGNNYAAQ